VLGFSSVPILPHWLDSRSRAFLALLFSALLASDFRAAGPGSRPVTA